MRTVNERSSTVPERSDSVPFNKSKSKTESNSESSVSFRNGLRASDVVREYAKAAKEAGNTRFLDAKCRAVLGAHALRLIRSEDWPPHIVLEAARKFAATQRSPFFFDEWVRLCFADEREREHNRRKLAEPKDGGLRSLFESLSTLGAPAARPSGRTDGPEHSQVDIRRG